MSSVEFKQSELTRRKQKRLFKKFRANPKLWIERCLKIIDKSGKEVPFKLNKIQDLYYEILKKEYWKPYTLASGKVVYRFQGIREVNLKARQFGLSSFICALLLHDTIFFGGTRTWLFCQDDEASKTMLEERVKYYFESIDQDDPFIVLPKPNTSNKKVLGFRGISSKFSARTPGKSKSVSRGKGRSITLRNALLSELAEWAYADELLQGLSPALEDPTTNIFIESSPKLRNDYFHVFYKMGKAGDGGWTSRFWPWFLHDEYQLPIYTVAERQKLEESLTEEEKKFIEYVRLEWMMDITLEQIKWRRKTKASPTLAAKGPNAFRQEYPENDIDCFEALGKSIFVDDNFDLGILTTKIRDAIPGRMHAIGADVSDGTGGDYSRIVVVDGLTREVIFIWSSNRIDSTQLHKYIHEIWQKYPGVVGIETNGIGRATIAMARTDESLVINEKSEQVKLCEDWDDFVHAGHGTYDGLPTLSEKSTTIYLLRAAIREAVEYYAPEYIPGPVDKPGIGLRIGAQEIIDEFPDFQNLGNLKMGAPEGGNATDDAIMALSIGFRLLPELSSYEKIFKRRFKPAECQIK